MASLPHLSPPWPSQIVSAKHVQRGKPAPDVYLEALRRLGCADASRALVVEDAGGWVADPPWEAYDMFLAVRTGQPLGPHIPAPYW